MILLLSSALLAGCQKKPEEIDDDPIIDDPIEVIEVNYDFQLNNTLAIKANEQSGLLESILRLSTGHLAENELKLARANLWTYSAYFTTVNQLYVMDPSQEHLDLLKQASEELEWYVAKERSDDHLVYASKNGSETPAFFDDNVWLVIGWLNGYQVNKDEAFLTKAKQVMDWIYTGWQDDEIGGLYWREFPDSYAPEQKQRNTCITGPAAWASAILYEITNDLTYLDWAMKIYSWTKLTLFDRINKVYHDNIDATGNITKWNFTYNQGTMLSAASLLYKITKDERYILDVEAYLEGAEQVFYKNNLFEEYPNGEFYKDNPWFRVYLVQGFFDAMRYVNVDYGYRLERVKNGILYGYDNHRDHLGFLKEDWSGRKDNEGVGGLFSNQVRTLYVLGNIEILAILDQYENYLKGVTK